MKVFVKQFNIDMEIKSSGIEFEVRSTDNQSQLGDCYVTMTGLTWCEGKKSKANGVKISWSDFQILLKSEASLKSAIKAAKGL